jgi:hypothetical protein
MAAIKASGKQLEGAGEEARVHRIRITLTSQDVKALEKGEYGVCRCVDACISIA